MFGANCTKPDCAYVHTTNKPAANKIKAPCHFFGQGTCTKGDQCEFSHQPVLNMFGKSGSIFGNSQQPMFAQQTKKPCIHFQHGNCNKGDKCAFLHEGPSQLSAAPKFTLPGSGGPPPLPKLKPTV